MTKKSYARQVRDAQKKEVSTCWDDLNNIYRQCQVLLATHLNIAQYVNQKDVLVEVADIEMFLRNMNMLTKDLESLSSQLTTIHDLHKDKVGGTEDPDVLIHTIDIGGKYSDFMYNYQQSTEPVVNHIMEQFAAAEFILNNKNKLPVTENIPTASIETISQQPNNMV